MLFRSRLLTGVLPDCDPGNKLPASPCAINPQVPVELAAICMKALAADCATRYATAGELAAELREFLGIKKRGLIGRITGRSKAGPAAPTTEKGQRPDFWK